MIDKEDIDRRNLQKGREAARLMREQRSLSRALEEARRTEQLLAELVEKDNPQPLVDALRRERDNHVKPALLKDHYGRARAEELAEDAMQETITIILRGRAITNLGDYMLSTARRLQKNRLRALQRQFAELYPSAEYKYEQISLNEWI